VPAQNLHVTISFLGWVDDERVAEISRAVATAVEGCARVPTVLAGLGTFPRASRARVIWAGLQDEGGALAAVADRVQQGVAAIGFEPEARAWQAHVTLARLREPQRVDLNVMVEPIEFVVDAVVLFRSILRRPAPVYEPVAIATLA
jgi:2'-5' RNA ligase